MAIDPQELFSGREQAKARDAWLNSEEGRRCRAGIISGQYLEKRLKFAFIAGVDAALAAVAKRLKETAAQAR